MSTETRRRQGQQPEDTPAVTVARAVAEREGLEPAALRPPLAAVVDTDALNALAGSGVTVEFSYRGHEVVVEDGRVSVAEP